MFISVVDLITAHILQSFRQKALISINMRRLDKLRTKKKHEIHQVKDLKS